MYITVSMLFLRLMISNGSYHAHFVLMEPAMLGHKSGFQARVKCVAPECTVVHGMLHRETLAAKTMPHQLTKVLKQVIKLVNFVKASALNTRLFQWLCEDTNAEHCKLLYNTEVRWLSKDVLKRVLNFETNWSNFSSNNSAVASVSTKSTRLKKMMKRCKEFNGLFVLH